MRNMQSSLHLVIVFLAFSCKAEVSLYFNTDKPVVTEMTNTSDAPDHFLSSQDDNSTHSLHKIASDLRGQYLTSKPTMRTVTNNVIPQSTRKETKGIKSNYTIKSHTPNPMANVTCTTNEKYKTGIIICAAITAVLVFIVAMLIVCIVVLANKVSSLKKRLTQSKRQARSNGDFLSASSILWPSGMETWQKKAQEANLTMDEISLGDTNTIENEKHKLMASPALEQTAEEKTSSPYATMTTVSTVEV
ncbi:protein EVI2A [Leptodactylus fuscus]|uniref:protein EVI2A n=1 Tax=Leptodactylus fuscus TaxID=238119 RepID=UPI003F4F0334